MYRSETFDPRRSLGEGAVQAATTARYLTGLYTFTPTAEDEVVRDDRPVVWGLRSESADRHEVPR